MSASGNAFVLQCFGLSLRKEDAQVPLSDLIRFSVPCEMKSFQWERGGSVLPLKCSTAQQVSTSKSSERRPSEAEDSVW